MTHNARALHAQVEEGKAFAQAWKQRPGRFGYIWGGQTHQTTDRTYWGGGPRPAVGKFPYYPGKGA